MTKAELLQQLDKYDDNMEIEFESATDYYSDTTRGAGIYAIHEYEDSEGKITSINIELSRW